MSEQARPSQKPRWRRILKSPWVTLIAVLVALGLVHGFIARPYQVPSGSMQETLDPGDRVYANRLAYLDAGPSIGDVIVFNQPDSWGPEPEQAWWRTAIGWAGDLLGFGPSNQNALLKRVIGTPGDRVACCDAEGRVSVNGEPLDESYIFEDYPFEAGTLDCETEPRSARCFDEIVLGEDQYLVMGDHRSNSADSVIGCRVPSAPDGCARLVSRDDVVGEVAIVVFPFTKWGQTLSVDPR